MTEERLQELEILCLCATEGPWHKCMLIPCQLNLDECISRVHSHKCSAFAVDLMKHKNLDFIIAARSAVPELIEEVRRLGSLASEYFAQAEQAQAEADWLAEQCQTLSGYSPILRQGLSKKQWLEAAHKDVNQEGL